MKLRRALSRTCIVIAIALLANMLPPLSGALAAPDSDTALTDNVQNTSGVNGVDFLARAAGLYDHLSGENSIFTDFDKSLREDYLINALGLNLISVNELSDYNHPISRQTAMNILYKTVLAYDKSFALNKDEADYILNSCYDNAELYPENRTAYAFMIKHGIITGLADTNPSAELTADEVDKLFSDIYYAFNKNIYVYIGGVKICAGDNESRLIDVLGAPDRTDPSEYGFDWYVYNSNASKYISVGVKGGKVCAFFTNAKTFTFGDMTPGTDAAEAEIYSDIPGLSFITDEQNRLSGVVYNRYSALDNLSLEEYKRVGEAKKLELIDLINAERAKNKLSPLTLAEKLEADSSFEVSGNNIFELYTELLGSGINDCTSDENTDYAVSASVSTEDGGLIFDLETAEKTGDIKPVKQEYAYGTPDYTVEKPEKISAPSLKEFKGGKIEGNNSDVTITLDKAVSNKYLVEIYDYEKDCNIVAQIITTDDTSVTYPAELFTGGSEYTVTVYAYDEDYSKLSEEEQKDSEEFIKGNEVVFAYGTAETPVRLITPFDGGYTYDDELEVTIESSVFHDFRIDVYDAQDKLVLTEKLLGKSFAILNPLPAGAYKVTVTALRRGTDEEYGSSTITCSIKDYVPEIKEYILKPGDEFTYIYCTPDMQFLYLYEEELITKPVTSVKTVEEEYQYDVEYQEEETVEYQEEVEVEYTDENGQTQTRTETVTKTKTEPVTKTRTETGVRDKDVSVTSNETYRKIIQKKVPATKKNLREYNLSGMPYSATVLGGTPTEFGNAYATLALSYQGVNYVWGGTTPNGFDCSGLVTYVAAQLGVKTHRVAEEQYLFDGYHVNRDELIPGDLVFFKDSTGYIHHVGIYIGNDMMVHAPRTGDVVRVASLNDSYYMKEYAGAKRLSAN